MRGGEQRNHYSIRTPLGIRREETIHCGLIRGKKVNYTGKPGGSCKAPVEEEQPPSTTPSYTRCLPRQKM